MKKTEFKTLKEYFPTAKESRFGSVYFSLYISERESISIRVSDHETGWTRIQNEITNNKDMIADMNIELEKGFGLTEIIEALKEEVDGFVLPVIEKKEKVTVGDSVKLFNDDTFTGIITKKRNKDYFVIDTNKGTKVVDKKYLTKI